MLLLFGRSDMDAEEIETLKKGRSAADYLANERTFLHGYVQVLH